METPNSLLVAVRVVESPEGRCVYCTPANLQVPGTSAVDISFTLDAPSGWRFAKPAIQFPHGAGHQFTQIRDHDREVVLRDRNSEAGTFTYVVHVTNGQVQLQHDPSIQNRSR